MAWAIKDQWPEEFKECKSHLGEDLYGKSSHQGTYGFFKGVLKFASKTLEDHEDDLKKKIAHVVENLEELLVNAVDGDLAEPYATFTHGDFWTNNVLYKHDEVSIFGILKLIKLI